MENQSIAKNQTVKNYKKFKKFRGKNFYIVETKKRLKEEGLILIKYHYLSLSLFLDY